eukprot:5087474-Alexandrium_andersonii.AAC.1
MALLTGFSIWKDDQAALSRIAMPLCARLRMRSRTRMCQHARAHTHPSRTSTRHTRRKQGTHPQGANKAHGRTQVSHK